jgi:hypothetical protein
MSQKASGFERKEGDQYMTPPWVAHALFAVMPLYGRMWEPSCGEGAIVRAARENPLVTVVGSDINPAFSDDGHSWDFLDPQVQASYFMPSEGPFAIITNPPYGKQGKLAEKFVRAAVEITQVNNGRVAMLLPMEWDAAKGRRDLFEDFHGHLTKITLTERIRWTNLPQSNSGPTQNHAWFVWDHSRRGRDMRWLGRISQHEDPK